MRTTLFAGLGAALAISAVSAIPTITTKGSKFFDSDGNQFFLKGIAYQLVPDDPLIDTRQCQLDSALMKTIGANSIRVYHVDPDANHDGCMQTFADAGIYLWVDLDTFNTQIEQTDPHWNETQFEAFQRVMDAFHQYDNVAGFYVGNEVLTNGNGSVAAPFVKAAARDMKAYRDSKGYRNIPVGYSAADIATLRPMLQNYLACGSNASEALDFFGLNAYEWCGQGQTYLTSGYSQLTQNITDYNIPIYFSETGCNTPAPRTFEDQSAIFGDEMNQYWSGAIVYEWIQEANNYGLISYGPQVAPTAVSAPPDGFTRSGTPTPISPDFPNLSNQWKTLTPAGIKAADYTPTLTPPPCPAFTSGVWEVNRDVPLPTVGQTFDAAVRSSITAGATGSPAATGSGSAASPSASKTGGAAPNHLSVQLGGMGVALSFVMVVFVGWL